MAIVILGGLISSTFVSLLLIPFSHSIQLRVLRAADTSLKCLSQQPKTQRHLLEDDLHPALCLALRNVAAGKVVELDIL